MVKSREEQLGSITILDENQDGYVSASGAIVHSVGAVLHESNNASPGNNSIWVNNLVPNELIFTDSVGADHNLISGAGGTINDIQATAGGITSVDTIDVIDPTGPTVTINLPNIKIDDASNDVVIGASTPTIASLGSQNTIIGDNAGAAFTGSSSVFIGTNAGATATGNGTVVIGSGSGSSLTSGTGNILLGATANTLTTGNGNVLIGTGADTPTSSTSSFVNIASTFTGIVGGNKGAIGDSSRDLSGQTEAFAIYGDGYVEGDLEVNGKLTVHGLIDPPGLILDEQVTAPYDPSTTGTEGLVWVRNDGYLIFTDQTGSDNMINTGGGSSGTTNHGVLTGLLDDDHTQYLLADGTRAMSGSINMGTNNITNVGTVDGVDISIHASRHESGGADAVDGYNLDLIYSPVNYNAPNNNLIGEHIAAIDDALASSGSGVTDHGALTGLADDDHTQYLLVDGTRAMSGNLDMGSNNIISVGTVDGRDVSTDGTTLDSHVADTSIHFTLQDIGLDGYALDADLLSAPVNPGDDNKVAIASGGDLTYAFVSNNNISDSANISVSKIEPGAPGNVLQTIGGVPTWDTIEASEISFDDTGLTYITATNVQAAISDLDGYVLAAPSDPGDDNKVAIASGSDLTYAFVSNQHISGSANISVDKLAPGAPDSILKTDGGVAVWSSNDAAGVSFDDTGLTNITATDVQDAISDLDAAIAASTLTAPLNPADDGLVAIASGGDLTYALILNENIDNNQISSEKMRADSVTSTALVDSAVINEKIANGVVDSNKIALIGSYWTIRTDTGLGFDGTIYAGTASGSTLITVGADGYIQSYSSGVWENEAADGGYTNTFNGATYCNGLFVIVGEGGEIQTSPDGSAWTTRTPDASYSGGFNAAACSEDLFIIVGDSAEIQTSPDGITWTARTPDDSYVGAFTSVTYGNGLFVIAGGDGEIQTSPDGITWTQRKAGTGSSADALYGLAYGNGVYVSVGGSGGAYNVFSSPDGITWTSRTANTDAIIERFRGVYYYGGVFVAVGNEGTIQTSTDGITWTRRSPDQNFSGVFRSVTFFNGKLYVLGGTSNSGGVQLSNLSIDIDNIDFYNDNNTVLVPNSLEFINNEAGGGNPTLKVSAEDTDQISALTTGTDYDGYFDSGENGYYQYSVNCVLKRASSGDYRRVSAVVDAVRSSETLTLEGTQTNLPGGVNTGITLTLDVSSESLHCKVNNSSGETVNGYIQVGWLRTDEVS